MKDKKNLEQLVSSLDLNSIVKKALGAAHEEIVGEPMELSEAYVATPKPFKQVTEYSSQETKDAHAELYKGYIEKLNSVSAELDSTDLSTEAGRLRFGNLKKEEAHLSNAVSLHEMFFTNCFAPNSELFQDMLTYIRLQSDWGDFNRWQMDLQNVATTGCGNGWVVCGYSMYHRRYLNMYIGAHSNHVLVGFIPVLVIDMHEHSYYRDYLNDKKSYLVAMMREINWDVVEERVKKVDALTKVMK